MSQQTTRSRSAIAAHPYTSAAITILMVADMFFLVYVPLYARLTPKLGDFPFFYWFLLIYIPVTSLVLWIVTLLQKRLVTPAEEGEGAR